MLNCHSVILREVAKIEKVRNAKKARGGAALRRGQFFVSLNSKAWSSSKPQA